MVSVIISFLVFEESDTLKNEYFLKGLILMFEINPIDVINMFHLDKHKRVNINNGTIQCEIDFGHDNTVGVICTNGHMTYYRSKFMPESGLTSALIHSCAKQAREIEKIEQA